MMKASQKEDVLREAAKYLYKQTGDWGHKGLICKHQPLRYEIMEFLYAVIRISCFPPFMFISQGGKRRIGADIAAQAG